MSKRAGEFVTLREVVDEVGRDAVQLRYALPQERRRARFRPGEVIEHSTRQPGFLCPVRACAGAIRVSQCTGGASDLPQAAPARAAMLKGAPLERLTDTGEVSLLRRIALYPRIIEAAAAAHEATPNCVLSV